MNSVSRRRFRTLAVLVAVAALTSANVGSATAHPAGGAIAPPAGIVIAPLAAGAVLLDTEQETTGSNTGAWGLFSYLIRGSQLCYLMQARNLSVPATAAHVHVGARNTAGPVVIPLTVGTGTSWTVRACTTADEDLLQAIADEPADYYINVHTATFPGGEIRGQLG